MASRAELEKFETRKMAHQYFAELDAFELYHREQAPSTLVGPALPALGNAASGAAGAAISNAIIYPLSLVITRLQVQRQIRAKASSEGTEEEVKRAVEAEYKDIVDAVQKIYQNEGGLKAFYAGVGQDIAKTVADSFLFFFAYSFLRNARQRSKGPRLPITDELGIGIVSGAFAKLFTTPIQNIVTRKQTAAMKAQDSGSTSSPDLNTKDIALQIREEKGLLGFWAGYSASLALTLNPGLTFLLHEALLRSIPSDKRTGPRITFAVAALSKAIASAVTYPFSVAKTRAQVSSKPPTAPHEGGDFSKEDTLRLAEEKAEKKIERNTVVGNILAISREEGYGALYHGLSGEVLKGFFQHGLTMLLKERVYVVTVQLYYLLLKVMRKYPSPEELASIARDRAERAATEAKATGERMVIAGQGVIVEATRVVTGSSDKSSVPAGDVYGKGPGKS